MTDAAIIINDYLKWDEAKVMRTANEIGKHCNMARAIACQAFIAAPSRASGTNQDE